MGLAFSTTDAMSMSSSKRTRRTRNNKMHFSEQKKLVYISLISLSVGHGLDYQLPLLFASVPTHRCFHPLGLIIRVPLLQSLSRVKTWPKKATVIPSFSSHAIIPPRPSMYSLIPLLPDQAPPKLLLAAMSCQGIYRCKIG